MRSELESAADEHRGETVLVISHGGAISVALPRLCTNVPADYAVGQADRQRRDGRGRRGRRRMGAAELEQRGVVT